MINDMISVPAPNPAIKHFLIVSAGTAGDIHPFLAIGCALRSRGHRVTFFCPEIHRHLVELAGIRCQPIGSEKDYLAILNNPDLWHPRKGIEVVLRNSGYGIDELIEFVKNTEQAQDCVMLAHPLTLPTAAVIRSQFPSLRIVGIYLAPSNLRSLRDPLTLGPLKIPRFVPSIIRQLLWNLIDRRVIDPAAVPTVNALHRTYGLLPIAHYVQHTESVPDLSVTLFPSWFGKTQDDWPQPLYSAYFPLHEPGSLSAFSPELTTFLSHGPAPLVFTHGTGNRHAAHYFRCAVKAVEKLQRRAIFLTPNRQQLPDNLSDDVLWQPYVSFGQLLPRSALLIHHGGIGTTAEALFAAVPQLVVPLGFDQFDNAARVESLGAGLSLFASRLSEKSLTEALELLLEPTNLLARKRRCKEIAKKFRGKEDEQERLCQAIESFDVCTWQP